MVLFSVKMDVPLHIWNNGTWGKYTNSKGGSKVLGFSANWL